MEKRPARSRHDARPSSGASRRDLPLWRGPLEDGISQSMLSKFICCRERFRLMVVEGLKQKTEFSHFLEYGQMWHHCEEAKHLTAPGSKYNPQPWRSRLKDYCKELIKQWPESGKQIEKWYNVCIQQFAVYLEYWQDHPDTKKLEVLAEEMPFSVAYTLPNSNREVTLRGVWDGMHLDKRKKKLYLRERKTKGDINPSQLVDELPFTLQPMLYLTALETLLPSFIASGFAPKGTTIGGFIYDVIRRPLSSRKYGITQRKGRGKDRKGAETLKQYYERLGELIRSDPGFFFYRWKVKITKGDLERFQQQTLNPLLEDLCDWWDYINDTDNVWASGNHWRMPFGVYNPMLEGRMDTYHEYLISGDEGKLERVDNLFPEIDKHSQEKPSGEGKQTTRKKKAVRKKVSGNKVAKKASVRKKKVKKRKRS